MAMPPPDKSDPVIVVGAGIFGLSTALHLVRRGYSNVTVFDKHPYERTLYSFLDGCDAASADINKIIRSAYGTQTTYQHLTAEALQSWNEWNDELRAGGAAVPRGMRTRDRVWINCGNISCNEGDTLPAFERATVDNMKAAGHGGTQLINNNPEHCKVAEQRGIMSAMHPFSKDALGVLDTTGGLAVADKACRFAMHKAKGLGVRFILDPEAGAFKSFVNNDAGTEVTGIRTTDGTVHHAAVTIMACGGWTPGLLPALDGLCETTAGSVFMLKIPESSPLWQRFQHSQFPSWTFKMRDGAEGGLYGFPVDDDGILKIGYRGTKYTNPKEQRDGKFRSIPVTRWSENAQLHTVPAQAHRVVGRFLCEYLPELGREGIGIWQTRVCWYTDSFDNHYVIDRVPGWDGLMCATGGSGHAFKYLPNIGNWVVDIMEGKGLEREAVGAWRWRALGEGEVPVNQLMQGSEGERALQNVELVTAGVA